MNPPPRIPNISTITFRRMGFSVRDSFCDAEHAPDRSINYYIQCPENVDGKLNEFPTMLVNLGLSPDELWNAIYHRTQTEIKSFLKNVPYEHTVEQDLTPERLDHIVSLLADFTIQKNIRAPEAWRLREYNKHGLLHVSTISVNGMPVSINLYRVNMLRASNIYAFRGRSSHLTPSAVGRAGRAHHWLCMLYFRDAGIQCYDFCGIDSDLEGITAFKRQFGGNEVLEYTGVIYRHPLLAWYYRRRK